MNRKKIGFTPLEMKVRISNRGGKRFLTGFTIVELLTSVAIIAMLVAMLVPALNLVRNKARETKQRAQFATIGMALLAFKGDDGDYPPSDWHPLTSPDYCGAQKLAEALLGWDLLGFHPDSQWRADGQDGAGTLVYDGTDDVNLEQRKGPYLELATTNVFRLGNNPVRLDPEGLFINSTPLNPDTFVLCDSFGVRRITITPTKTVKAGTPILYYKANTSSNNIDDNDLAKRIYDARNNIRLVDLGKLTETGLPGASHRLCWDGLPYNSFYISDPVTGEIGYIRDPKVTVRPWPYRADSYILISAGADGEYGTRDDICNF